MVEVSLTHQWSMSSMISSAHVSSWVWWRYSLTHVTRWSLKTPLMSWCKRSGNNSSWMSACGNPSVNSYRAGSEQKHNLRKMTQTTTSARIPYSSHNIPGSKFLIRKSVFSWVCWWEPGALRLVGLASHLPIIIVRSLAQLIKDVKYILWTPIWDCSRKPNLLWVISNVWSKTEDCTMEVTIWTFDNLWRFHIRLKRCKCKLKALVIELSAELLECGLLSWDLLAGK